MESFFLNYQIILLILSSYLLGSIPFGYLIFKFKKKSDIREFGSGNIGATNVNRLLGKKLGILTLILDFSKTFVITLLIFRFYGSDLGSICGLFSIIGHVFPLWLKFKGGKGVASFLGLLFVISWPLSLFFCLVWIIAVKALKYSGAAAIISLVLVILIFKIILHIQFSYNTLLWIPGTQYEFNIITLLSALILLKHYSNIISFFKK